jgi:hypothetical protein
MSPGFWLFMFAAVLLIVLLAKRPNRNRSHDRSGSSTDSGTGWDAASSPSCHGNSDFSCDGDSDGGGD